jgi:Calcineurin-like phosphoesterase
LVKSFPARRAAGLAAGQDPFSLKSDSVNNHLIDTDAAYTPSMMRFSSAPLLALLVIGLTSSGADAARHVSHPKQPTPLSPAEDTFLVARLRPQLATTGALRSAWTQYGPDGVVEARTIVEGKDCPEIALDLKRSQMKVRVAADANFLTVCAAPIPPGTKQAALVLPPPVKSPPPLPAGPAAEKAWVEEVTGVSPPGANASPSEWLAWRDQVEAKAKYDLVPLPLPVADPQRILVLGDTGCRIKGTELQDCSNPDLWPFARIAAEAARLKPDLVIDVGDYLYRENACPADFKGCSGTPHGDNWPTWDADFFTPARPLLAVAPWVIVRGNHEDCQRAGLGFLRLLGPQGFDPAAACIDHLPQYFISLARMTLAVEDDADAPDTSVVDKVVPTYKEEIAALAAAKPPVWWLQHRPIWGVISGPLGLPVGGNLTMVAAAGSSGIPSPVELMLAGHIHSFEAINYEPDDHVPPQIVAGFGGDELDATPASLHGAIFQGSSGVHVKDGISIGGFGFLLLTRMENGWTIDAYDPHGQIERQCLFHNGRVDCPTRRR